MNGITRDDLVALVYREAELFDVGAWDAWYDLFADDAIYWLPLDPAQTDPRLAQSVVCEDKLLLAIRLERYRGPKTWSQQPPARCQHVLQAPRVEMFDITANSHVTRAPFFYVEVRGDQSISLAGRVTHRMRAVDGRLRIVEKRVDLVNADAALPPIWLLP